MVGLDFPGVYGPCSAGLDVHHIQARGSGGADRKENLISVCRAHHDLAKTGRIGQAVFRGILARRYGYQDG